MSCTAPKLTLWRALESPPPQFKHDCVACLALGSTAAEDLYFCAGRLPTVIARYGSRPPEYFSGLEVALAFEEQGDFEYPLVIALRLARMRGLVKSPLPHPVRRLGGGRDSFLIDVDAALIEGEYDFPPWLTDEDKERTLHTIEHCFNDAFWHYAGHPQVLNVMRGAVRDMLARAHATGMLHKRVMA